MDSEPEDFQRDFQKSVREIEDRLKRMVADQAWKTEANAKKAAVEMAKEQERHREELKTSIEGSMKEMRAQIDTLVKSMVQLADAVNATRVGPQGQQTTAAEASVPRRVTLEGGSPTPPGEGSLTPVEVIPETQATPGSVPEEGGGIDAMVTSEAVRRIREEEPREGRSAERKHKKSKSQPAGSQKDGSGRSRSRSNEE